MALVRPAPCKNGREPIVVRPDCRARAARPPDQGSSAIFGNGNQPDPQSAEQRFLPNTLRNFLRQRNEREMGENPVPRRLLNCPLPVRHLDFDGNYLGEMVATSRR